MIEPLEDIKPGLPSGPFWRMAGNLGFGPVSISHIHLLTTAEFLALDKGTILYAITGERVVVGVDYVDADTRGGYVAYGKLCIFRDCIKED